MRPPQTVDKALGEKPGLFYYKDIHILYVIRFLNQKKCSWYPPVYQRIYAGSMV